MRSLLCLILLFLFPVSSFGAVTEDIFYARVNEVFGTFHKWMTSNGAEFVLDPTWNSAHYGGTTDKLDVWHTKLSGSLFHFPKATADSVSLIACHELGHLIGGFPFQTSTNSVYQGISSEGQADYFATQVCLKQLWKNAASENAVARLNIDPVSRRLCDSVYPSESSQNLCYRIIAAGINSEALIAETTRFSENPLAANGISDYLDNEKPAPQTIAGLHSYPSLECRLTTFVRGALCDLDYSNYIIPGTSISLQPGESANGANVLDTALKFSCFNKNGHTVGARPPCWFKEL